MDDFDSLKKSRIFKGIEESEFDAMFKCLAPEKREFKKGEMIISSGDKITKIGIIVTGSVIIERSDYWGNRTILSKLREGQLFAEAFALSEKTHSTVDVKAAEDTSVFFINSKKLMTVCPNACVYHSLLIRNLVSVLAGKNIMLTDKMNHLSKRTTREKLISYLSQCSKAEGSAEFDIPFSRQQLADFLCVDRSAMSAELCKLRDEGLISFKKEHFILK